MFNKILGTLLFLGSFAWFYDIVLVIQDKELNDLTICVALFITGCVVFKWGVEAWDD